MRWGSSRLMKKIFILIFLFSLYGCKNTASDSIDVVWLYEANPLEDFKESVNSNDYRFVGVYGYSLTVPGVALKCIDIEKDVKPIEGTSDSYSSYEEEKFNAVAKVYADYYNFQLIKYLESKNSFTCKGDNPYRKLAK